MYRLLTGALICLTGGAGLAQSDTIFPNVGGSWDMTTITWDWDGQNMNFEYWPHHMQYTAEPSVEEFGFSWGAVYDGFWAQVGLIAVDSGRVYYRATALYTAGIGGLGYGDTTMRVLYDFDLALGDTAYIQNGLTEPPGWPVIVQDIDTVFMGGFPRRRFELDNGDVWVEGIGSLEGLLRPFLEIFENGFSLDDFCGQYMTVDGVPYTSCLPLVTGDPEQPRSGLAVHPNPSDGTFVLSGMRPGTTYRVIDARGVVVLSGRTEASATAITMTQAAAGIYLLRIDGSVHRIVIE
ncbi:MAG: T9SS type A sorting domain-containing protein [Flavobacteriales bacterium]